MNWDAIGFFVFFYGVSMLKAWYVTLPILFGIFYGSRRILQHRIHSKHFSGDLLALTLTVISTVPLAYLSAIILYRLGKIDFPMKITVQQSFEKPEVKSVTLGEADFSASDSEPLVIGLKLPLRLQDGKQLEVRTSYAEGVKNMSVSVLIEKQEMFVGMAQWNTVAPYFAFRLADDSVINLYFSK